MTGGKKIRILVVDDSAYHRRTLVKIISSDAQMEVVGTAGDGEEAIKRVVDLKPDLVTLDLEMPRMDGFTFLRWLMRNYPLPVLVVTSRESNRSVFKALDFGAVDFVVKPVKYASIQLGSIEGEVLEKIREISVLEVKDLPAKLSAMSEKRAPQVVKTSAKGKYDLIAIGASTGGPPALQSILTRLPRGFPAGIVISQHMPEGFTKLFAERLNRLVGIQVSEAQTGDEVEKGKALIAPGGRNLVVGKGKDGKVLVDVIDANDEDRYVPSIDAMMESASRAFDDRMIGVILTGMGDDGVKGMSAIRKAGGLTIAESEQTCIVYGMPREAINSGVVDKVLPLAEIGEMVIRKCQGAA